MTISGITPVIPTPMKDGRFDLKSFQRLLDYMHDDVDGYVLLGSTGEAPSLTVPERKAIAEAALKVTDPAKQVVVGVTTTCLADAVELARHAQDHGASGVLCAAPYYFSNTPDGIRGYLAGLDAVLSVEMVLYDNPAATGTTLTASSVVSWSHEFEHLNSVKLTDHALEKIPIWQSEGLLVYGGDDPIAFQYLRAGVDGMMIIAPAVFPAAFRTVWELCQQQRYDEALEVFGPEIAPFIHVFGIGQEIATTKALLAEISVFDSAEVLPPLLGTDGERTKDLLQAYEIGTRNSHSRLREAVVG